MTGTENTKSCLCLNVSVSQTVICAPWARDNIKRKKREKKNETWCQQSVMHALVFVPILTILVFSLTAVARGGS